MQYIFLSFLFTFLTLLAVLKTPLRYVALDQPNHRSLHINAIPRTGGLAIMCGILTVWGLAFDAWFLIALVLMLITVSIVDDLRGLSALLRLLAHLAVAALFLRFTANDLNWICFIALVIAIAWMSNLYNFMDGSDGLAGGMGFIGFGFFALAAYLANDLQFALMSGCIAAANLAFLCFNFHPARIFMGDAGSVPLGFLAGALGFYGWQHGFWPAWFPIVIFAPFIFDATVTLIKRACRGEKIWQAHRSHYYQRLVQMGGGHRNTAIAEYVLMILLGFTAIYLLGKPFYFVLTICMIWLMILTFIMVVIDKKWEKIRH